VVNVLGFDILARDRASSTLKRVGAAADGTGRRFKQFGVISAIAGTTAGLAIAKFGKDSINAFKESEDAQVRLQDAFARFPNIADSNIQAFQGLNQQLQLKTKFDDEAYASGQAILAQFGLTGKKILEVTPLLGDYAAKTGKDIPTAATLLGKSFLGNTRALKALGISYKTTGNQALDTANILDLVRQKVGGFAEKEGKTAAGQIAILGNRFEELQEKVGAALLPALGGLAKTAMVLVDAFGHLNPQTQQLALVMGALGIAALLVGPRIAAMSAAMKEAGIAAGGLSKGVGIATVALLAFQLTADASLKKAADMSKSFGDRAVEAFRAVARYGGMSGTAIARAAEESNKSTTATKGATTAADQYQQILGDVTSGVNGFADATQNAYEAQQRLNGTLLDATEADIGFRDAVASWAKKVRDATKAGDAHTHSLSLNNQAGRDNVSALTEMAKKANAHAQAVFDQTGSLGKANKALRTDRERLLGAATAAGFNRTEIDKLIRKYLKIPTKAQTKVEQPGMTAAQSKALGLKKKMQDIDRTFRSRVVASVTGLGAIDNLKFALGQLPTHINVSVGARVTMGGAFLGRQHGGPVRRGVPYIVGERRPELFVPNQNGRIIPQVSGGGVTINGGLHLHGIQDINQMIREIQRYAKRNSGIPGITRAA